MSYEQFWYGEPSMVIAYRKAHELRRKQENTWLWLQGMYVAEALSATVGNMFSKGNKHQYPAEPYPISLVEQEERREREERMKMERIKAAFTARALAMNTKMGGQTK